MKKLTKTGKIFFGIMLFVGIVLAAMDFESMTLFIVSKVIAAVFIIISGNLLINSIEQ